MGRAAANRHLTVQEYLAWEATQGGKHEYRYGEVFPIVGGSPRHNVIAAAVVAELRGALRGKGCHVLTSDQRISAKPGQRYVYPDAAVVCGSFELEAGTTDVLASPHVVVEVLSKSTEAYDRGSKWDAYQRLPTLQDYLLFSQTARQVEHYQREEDSWRYRLIEAGERVTLKNGATFALDAVYEGAFDVEGE